MVPAAQVMQLPFATAVQWWHGEAHSEQLFAVKKYPLMQLPQMVGWPKQVKQGD